MATTAASLIGQGLVDGRLEASHVLDRSVLCVRLTRPQVLVQGGKDLGV